jgi:mRNA interferase MazF
MERGDICWYNFGHPDKRRPIIILTRDSAIQYLGEVIIAPITSTIRSILTEVFLDESDGMKHPCCINLDHIQTVSKAKIGKYISKISDNKLVKIKSALLFACGFDN